MIEFLFKPVQTRRGILYRPRANVDLIGSSETFMVDCLVDSGADTTVFAWQVGQTLGWSVNSSEISFTMGGVGGTLAYYQRQVEMKIGSLRFKCSVMWALSDDVPNILGRQDVFDRFNIEFCQSDKKVVFRPS